MKINVGSKSPAKLKAINNAFSKLFNAIEIEIIGYAVASDVSEQPLSEEETLLGATNRAKKAYDLDSSCNISVGIEGGVTVIGEKMYTFGWIVIFDGQDIGTARSSSFELPHIIKERIDNGEELGPINDDIFKTNASKKTKGALGCLTNGVINRDELYQDAIIMAYIPFLNAPLFNL